MKRPILLFTVLLLLYWPAKGQKSLLSLDEHNKYIYYQVVDIPGQNADSLNLRGLNFLKSVAPKIKIAVGANANSVGGEGKFLTTTGVSMLKRSNGEMTYKIIIECKDQKYRYWLTNFTFTPYIRDRYGNFVLQQGIDIPLEDVSAKLDKKDADNYLNETGAFCKQLGDKLKLNMVKAPAPKKVEITKKTITDK